MIFEEGMKKSIEELVDKKTALEKRIFELEKENEDLKAEIGLNEATIQEQLEDRVKVIKENEDLKNQIEQMKCCGNCQSIFDADERSNRK